MPTIDSNGCPLHVELSGPDRAPVLMLSNSLGTTLHMWDDQVRPFTEHFRLIRYDRRGHGRSGVPEGPYSMEMLGRDALAILDALNVKRANWCGLSMGGMVGMWLGANAPERFNRMVYSNTTSHYEDKTPWIDRIKLVSEQGLAPLVDVTLERWFTKDFRDRAPKTVHRVREMFLSTAPKGYVACCEAIRDMDLRPGLGKIKVPVLVIAGRADPATTLAMGEALHEAIPGSKLAVLEAAHIANIEQSQKYTDTVLDFLLD
jgi:3-oxoadipate enol-lactonase